MSNDFYVQGSDASKESFNAPQLVQFEWNIVYSCNFRCPYCIFEGKWEEYGKRNVFLPAARWVEIWERIYKMYGRCSMLLTGGEPFVYPGFLEIIGEISRMHYPINISTNGSGDIAGFIRTMDPKKVSLTLSFHPEFNSLDDVLRNKKLLDRHGFTSEFINLCCYPTYFAQLDGWVKKAVDAGEKLKVIPFCGPFQGKPYPDSYSPEEKAKLGLNTTWESNVKRKGRVCRSGMRSALVFPDGKVVRCGQIGEKFVIGSIFDENFRLLDAPLPCEVEYCPCLEGE